MTDRDHLTGHPGGASRAGEPADAEGGIPLARLVQMFRDPDPRVRSRLAGLLGRFGEYHSLIARRLEEDDPRVRANTLQSLWNVDSPAARKFMEKSVGDPHHRVRTNAIIGLYLMGETAAIPLLLAQVGHSSPLFRAAAAWAMGRTADPRFAPALEQLAADQDAGVRQAATGAQVRIEARIAEAQKAPRIPLSILAARDAEEYIRLSIVMPRENADRIRPTSFIIAEQGRIISSFEAQRIRPDAPIRVGVAIAARAENEWLGAAEAVLHSRADNPNVFSIGFVRYQRAPNRQREVRHGHATIFTGSAALEVEAPEAPLPTHVIEQKEAFAGLATDLASRGGERALVIVTDPCDPASIQFNPAAALVAALRNRQIPLYALAITGGAGTPLETACLTTGGAFLRCPAPEDVSKTLETLLSSLQDRFQIRYLPDTPPQGECEIIVSVYAPDGYGQEAAPLN